TMIIDDCVAFIGSANLNHRSMTNDTELHLSVLDAVAVDIPMNGTSVQACKFAHEYRCRLWEEHLLARRDQVIDPISAIHTLWAAAPAPGGRVFPHHVSVPGLDVAFVAKLIANSVTQLGLPPIPGLLLSVLPPGEAALQRVMEA